MKSLRRRWRERYRLSRRSEWRRSRSGGAIDKHVRTLPDGKTQQQILANGVAFDGNGVLHVTDTARGAV